VNDLQLATILELSDIDRISADADELQRGGRAH
jgi:hypothetical protein